MDNTEIFICECSSAEHQMIIRWDSEDLDDDFVYVTIHLNPEYSIWNRVKHAIKYIFGYRSRYGHFDEIILKKSDANNLQKVVDVMRRSNRANERIF
jgi:hypothetical protein